jgi:hypothetical protein
MTKKLLDTIALNEAITGSAGRRLVDTGADSDLERDTNDAYNSPIDVPAGLLAMEQKRVPQRLVEPACGSGTISLAMGVTGRRVESSDLLHTGFGYGGHDFLQRTVPAQEGAGLITNPPFKLFTEFLTHANYLGFEYIALFGKLRYLEGQARTLEMERCKLTRVWVYDYRVVFEVAGKPRNLFGFAWMVFDLRNQSKDGEMWGGGWIRRHHVAEWIEEHGEEYNDAQEMFLRVSNQHLMTGEMKDA